MEFFSLKLAVAVCWCMYAIGTLLCTRCVWLLLLLFLVFVTARKSIDFGYLIARPKRRSKRILYRFSHNYGHIDSTFHENASFISNRSYCISNGYERVKIYFGDFLLRQHFKKLLIDAPNAKNIFQITQRPVFFIVKIQISMFAKWIDMMMKKKKQQQTILSCMFKSFLCCFYRFLYLSVRQVCECFHLDGSKQCEHRKWIIRMFTECTFTWWRERERKTVRTCTQLSIHWRIEIQVKRTVQGTINQANLVRMNQTKNLRMLSIDEWSSWVLGNTEE